MYEMHLKGGQLTLLHGTKNISQKMCIIILLINVINLVWVLVLGICRYLPFSVAYKHALLVIFNVDLLILMLFPLHAIWRKYVNAYFISQQTCLHIRCATSIYHLDAFGWAGTSYTIVVYTGWMPASI